MGVEENKVLARRIYEEVVNRGQIDLADRFIAADSIEHEEITANGRDSFKEFFTAFRASFPDLNFKIEDLIAEEDKVVARISVTGTHNGTGDFMGFAPSGKKINVETIDILRFENGMVVEHWGKTDLLGLLEQLGERVSPETINKVRAHP